MLPLNYIQKNKNFIIEKLSVRGVDFSVAITKIIELNNQRKSLQQEINSYQQQLKENSIEIGIIYKKGLKSKVEKLKKESSNLKCKIANKNQLHQQVLERIHNLLCDIPNIPHSYVHAGNNAKDNEIIREGGSKPTFTFSPLPHWELIKKYDIIDFTTGSKITGVGFPLFKGKGAKLARALINFFLDENIKNGYEEVAPPLLVNEDSAFATGQLPDKEGQMYHITEDNLYLIPTSEVPVTNIFRNCILSKSDFPKKFTSYTPCFRREAGSYGKNVRGLNRIHQFDKVEIVQLTLPETSYQTLDEMVNHIETIVKKLKLPYRIVRLYGKDLGFASALTYDFEVYSSAQQKWLEVSSVSNFEAYQANRLKIRYKDDGKITLGHTLNGSALALPRIIAAILENNQTEHTITIPEVLRDYTKFDMIN